MIYMVMKKGSRHHWAYRGHWKERKVAPGVWFGSFKATKSQRPRPGVAVGSRYKWRIRGLQSAVKTSAGQYQTNLRFKKTLVKADPSKTTLRFKVKKRRKR